LGPVDRADTAALEPELEQLGERVGVALAEDALVDCGDEVGEPQAPALVLHHREHGLCLGARDLGRLAGDLDADLRQRALRSVRAARARGRRSRSSSGCRTPWARPTPTTSGRSG